jgi:predicted O-methyltransferase YrrM
MASVIRDPQLEELLERLHRQSSDQSAALANYFSALSPEKPAALNEADIKRFLSDKLVALDRDKAEFCYQICRALNARRIVEAGTSHGVSTLYLAAAARDNVRANGGTALVIGTEYEPAKANIARANFAEAGLAEFIDLREGDLRETLKALAGPVDFALIDIWTQMAQPALERIAPHLRVGAVVICDNTETFRDDYRAYFSFIADPANHLRTMTLPFAGGLEMTVRV